MPRVHYAACHKRTAIGAVGEGLYGAGNFVAAASGDRRHLQPTWGCHGLNNTELSEPGGVGIVAKNGHPGHVRRDLLEEIQIFSAETEFEGHEASYVAPWPGQAVNDAR